MKLRTFITIALLPTAFLAGKHFAPITIEPRSFYEDAVRVAYSQGVHDGKESLLVEVLSNGEIVEVASAK